MNSYALIDLHCDTLTDCIHKNSDPDTLDDPGVFSLYPRSRPMSTGHSSTRYSFLTNTAGRPRSITMRRTGITSTGR